jgi:hypothetical protein
VAPSYIQPRRKRRSKHSSPRRRPNLARQFTPVERQVGAVYLGKASCRSCTD